MNNEKHLHFVICPHLLEFTSCVPTVLLLEDNILVLLACCMSTVTLVLVQRTGVQQLF